MAQMINYVRMDIFLVIPAFNESSRLPAVLRKANHFLPKSKIIVVDDGSAKPINATNALVIRHQLNLGKGAAMKTGADYAFGQGAGAVIFMDADGQHDPKELPNFVGRLETGCDVVFGSRRPGLTVPLTRLMGNKFASIYINLLFGIYVSDILSGYRALTKKAYRLLNWDSDRYGVETEIVARLGGNLSRLKWTEFPVETIYIDKYKGVTIIDAIKVLTNTLWWKLF